MNKPKRERPKIRVLYIIGTLVVGGAEGQLVSLVTRLDRRRFEPLVCCLNSEGPLRGELDAADIPVVNIGFSGFSGFRRNPRRVGQVSGEILKLLRHMHAFRPDIVHGFLFWAYVLGAFAAGLTRVPIIVTSRRSLGDYKASERIHLTLEQIANRLTDVVVANSEAVRQDTIARERLAQEKVGVIYNGIEMDRYRVPPSEQLRQSLGLVGKGPVVGVVANLRPRKGHEFLLEAWAMVIAKHPNGVMLLIGDGPVRGELEARAELLGVSQSVRFLGLRRDVPDLLALVDVAVHPSLAEGFSNAILEAMAAGKPVVATAVGGNPEAVVDGVTGLVVPPQDGQALAEAMLWLMGHPDEAVAYGRAGRERVVQRFDLQVMVEQYEQLYERLLAERGVGRSRGVVSG